MSQPFDVLVDPRTGSQEQAWVGFSWPCLVFGVFWFLYKQLYGWAVISLLVAVITGGFSWLVFPFFANRLHWDTLTRQGWVPAELAGDYVISDKTHWRCPDCREIIRKDARVCKHCRTLLEVGESEGTEA